ncbi:MAG: hypothetical protein ACLSEN_04280 [Faecalibacterium sp.]
MRAHHLVLHDGISGGGVPARALCVPEKEEVKTGLCSDKSDCKALLCFDEKYAIIKLPLWRQGAVPQTQAAFSPYRHLSAPGKEIFLETSLPRTLEGGKGGCTMTFEQVVLLLTLLGGAIYVTFEITWTVSHSDRRKKK